MLKSVLGSILTLGRVNNGNGRSASGVLNRASFLATDGRTVATLSSHLSTKSNHSPESQTLFSSSSSLQLVRYKHSQRQVKRIYNKNPSRIRVLERERLAKIGLPLQRPIKANMPVADIEYLDKQPKFEAIYKPKFLKNGWCAPASMAMDPPPSPPPEELYPFIVRRTGSKPNGAIGFLPVYCDFKHGRSQVTTLIRKVDFINPSYQKRNVEDDDAHGIEIFVEELKTHLAKWHKRRVEGEGRTLKGGSVLPEIRIRSGNQIEIMGNYGKQVRYWLASLGF